MSRSVSTPLETHSALPHCLEPAPVPHWPPVRYVPGRIFDSCNASKSAAVYDIDLHDQHTSVVALMCQGTIVSVPLYRSVGLVDAAIAI